MHLAESIDAALFTRILPEGESFLAAAWRVALQDKSGILWPEGWAFVHIRVFGLQLHLMVARKAL